MAKQIDYTKNTLSTIPRAKGAAQYYTRGDQVYMQPVDDEGEFIANGEIHIDHSRKGETDALKIADSWQRKENNIVNKTKNKSK